jgi:DNA repair protein RadC
MSRPRRQYQSPDQLPLLVLPHTPDDVPDETAPPYTTAVYRVALVRESSMQTPVQIHTSRDIAAIVRERLGDADREHFVALLLDRKNKLIGINTVSIGSLTAAIVHPREVFKPAILGNAAAIVCAHNHPSGDPQPSAEDRTLTSRLVQGGKLLGIEVLDHVIIGDGRIQYFSFADAGCLG